MTTKPKTKKQKPVRARKRWVCLCCGALFIDGKGFVEPHNSLCANDRYGWNFVREEPRKTISVKPTK